MERGASSRLPSSIVPREAPGIPLALYKNIQGTTWIACLWPVPGAVGTLRDTGMGHLGVPFGRRRQFSSALDPHTRGEGSAGGRGSRTFAVFGVLGFKCRYPFTRVEIKFHSSGSRVITPHLKKMLLRVGVGWGEGAWGRGR